MSNTKKIRITNSKFLNSFVNEIEALSKIPSNTKTGKVKYSIKRSLPNIQEAIKTFNKERKFIFEDRAKVDENGNPKFDENGNYLFDSKEIRKEAFEALEALEQKEIEIEVFPISITDLTAAVGNISIGTEINLGDFIIDNDIE